MFSTEKLLTHDNILKLVNDYQIYRFYIPHLKVGKITNSPFREDKHGSFGIFADKYSKSILFKDFRIGSGNVFQFVSRLFNINFKDSIRKINLDMNLGLYDTYDSDLSVTKGELIKDLKVPIYRDTLLQVKRQPLSRVDYKYWDQYHITELLEESKTYPISHFKINHTTIKAKENTYSLDFYHDGIVFRRKIYQPLNKNFKWISNITSLVVDGIKELPKTGDLLFITKSRKDRLELKKLGFNAIATNNEASFIPIKEYDELKQRFKRIILFFDNDEAGILNSIKFNKEFDIEYIIIPENEPKDISDYVKTYGLSKGLWLIKQLIYDT